MKKDFYLLKLKHYNDCIQYTYLPDRFRGLLSKNKNCSLSSKNKNFYHGSFESSLSESLRCSLSRSISKIKDYCLCNDFDYFFTLTLKTKKRNNVSFACNYINKCIKAYARKREGFKYIYIFEKQKKGRNSYTWFF